MKLKSLGVGSFVYFQTVSSYRGMFLGGYFAAFEVGGKKKKWPALVLCCGLLLFFGGSLIILIQNKMNLDFI